MAGKRVCVIGSGPSGMAFLYHIEKLRVEGCAVPEVVCYDKQSDWGGLWNYDWRTGTDKYGEPVHGSMYRYLWSNGPKEASLEFPDYLFEEHFGKQIPSFPPREVLFDYIKGRWKKHDLRRYVKFQHIVKDVKYNASTDNFCVRVKRLEEDTVLPPEKFDYVINASGHFSVPNVPEFEGFRKFNGRVMHSHDFRDAAEFKGRRLLIVGSSYSAEDISLQTLKYGAKDVIVTYRNSPMGFKWPKGIEERPLVQRFDETTAYFKDGTKAEIDTVILCTGYLHHYPHLADDLRYIGPNILYPDNLYKGTLWMKGGNNRMMYIGAMDQYYTWTMFDAQAKWAVQYIMGKIKLPEREAMMDEIKKWTKREKGLKDCHEQIDFQRDFTEDVAKDADYGCSLDVAALFHTWEGHKYDNILTYRDQSFASIFSGKPTPVHHSSFMEALDDSMETYLKVKD